MKKIIIGVFLLGFLTRCYKDNGEPLRSFVEFDLGISYDTIPCKSATQTNFVLFGSGRSSSYRTTSYGRSFSAEKNSSFDIYNFTADMQEPPNKSAYFTTTTGRENTTNIRFFLSRNNGYVYYICEPGKKVFIEILPQGVISYIFCGGTFFNTDNPNDSVVVQHAHFQSN